MYRKSQSLSQLCEQREIMLSQLRRKRRENMLEQKRSFENMYSLNILEMAKELNEEKAFDNFTYYIQSRKESKEKCNVLIKFNNDYYHYFTTLDHKYIIIKEVTDNVSEINYRNTITKYLQNISTKTIEYMIIHYIGKYIKFTNFDSFVNCLNLFHEHTIKAKKISGEILSSFSSKDYIEYEDSERLLHFIDLETVKLGSNTYNKCYKNLIIINYSNSHHINLDICNLNNNYKINIINNVLLLRFSKDIELNEFILKFADIINDEKNYTFLSLNGMVFKIYNTNKLIDINRYLNDYYISSEDYQMLVDYNHSKRNTDESKDCDLDLDEKF